ncbi:MAG TPA: acyl-CoA dehydrogenase family protein [Gemmataceae bacterium]|jgi:alkylation response protein AidB-like acyl-CoA dehydrogenase|nr:acyl-CoA dehydrogenase family protein [Gemmataceae bacterium]
MSELSAVLHDTLNTLRENADRADDVPTWPEASWRAIQDAGVLKWCIPQANGGSGLDPLQLLEGYELLANACLTTCFILSQRDAACRRLREHGASGNPRQLLAKLAAGQALATVGVSQLTTSRQHGGPALVAKPCDRGYSLTGVAPWVTGAEQADFLILGASLDDGRQLIGVVARKSAGLTVGPPLELMALRGSLTAWVTCEDVLLENEWILAGPVEKVLQTGKGGAGGLETSCLAIGVARAAIDLLLEEAKNRPALLEMCERLGKAHLRLRGEMHGMAGTPCSADAATDLRAKANTLVLRATQAALTMTKGAGFVHPHPAQRLARQAMFFLVWSCPQPAAAATLEALGGNGAMFCS